MSHACNLIIHQITRGILINLSCWRMPASRLLKTLDPGLRRDDENELIRSSLEELITKE
jgi:hypothetical protein